MAIVRERFSVSRHRLQFTVEICFFVFQAFEAYQHPQTDIVGARTMHPSFWRWTTRRYFIISVERAIYAPVSAKHAINKKKKYAARKHGPAGKNGIKARHIKISYRVATD